MILWRKLAICQNTVYTTLHRRYLDLAYCTANCAAILTDLTAKYSRHYSSV